MREELMYGCLRTIENDDLRILILPNFIDGK